MRTGIQLYRLSVHSYVIYAEIELQVDITELLVVMGAKDSLGIENYHYIYIHIEDPLLMIDLFNSLNLGTRRLQKLRTTLPAILSIHT